jgi:acyl-CoA hydrolase
MENSGKTIAESATVLSQIILPHQTNPAGTAHGGELLKMMDNCAGACATKHSRSIVVTAGIDNINFHAPVYVGNLATCHAYLSYVSNRSMEIAVSIYAEDLLEGSKECSMTAYFIFVALDENMQPKQLEPLHLVSDLERQDFEAGKARMAARKENPKVCWLPLNSQVDGERACP